MFKSILLVGIGGFVGSIFRYLLSKFIAEQSVSVFPFGTFAVNIIGCLAIGLIYGLTIKDFTSSELRLLLTTGLCGGFTTFSSFSIEFFILLRDDHISLAMIYALGSMVLGLAAVWLGIIFCKSL